MNSSPQQLPRGMQKPLEWAEDPNHGARVDGAPEQRPNEARCAVSLGSASAIIADLVEDPQDNGEYKLNVSGMPLALLWEAVEAQEAELRELRKDKARLDSGEIMHRCCGDRVHFVKQDLRAAIDEALSQNNRNLPSDEKRHE